MAEIIHLRPRPAPLDPTVIWEQYASARAAWLAVQTLRGHLQNDFVDELARASHERQARLFNAWLKAVGGTPGGAA